MYKIHYIKNNIYSKLVDIDGVCSGSPRLCSISAAYGSKAGLESYANIEFTAGSNVGLGSTSQLKCNNASYRDQSVDRPIPECVSSSSLWYMYSVLTKGRHFLHFNHSFCSGNETTIRIPYNGMTVYS